MSFVERVLVLKSVCEVSDAPCLVWFARVCCGLSPKLHLRLTGGSNPTSAPTTFRRNVIVNSAEVVVVSEFLPTTTTSDPKQTPKKMSFLFLANTPT